MYNKTSENSQLDAAELKRSAKLYAQLAAAFPHTTFGVHAR